MAVSVLVIMDEQFRDQIVQFANADIAAVREGYNTEGEAEAREVIGQRMAAPGASDFFLLQRDGMRLAGNLPPMPPRTGILTLPCPAPAAACHSGRGRHLAPGPLCFFRQRSLSRPAGARQHILRTLLWVFAGGAVARHPGRRAGQPRFLSRTDAIARACRAIMDGNLKTRIPVRGTQDELDRLSQTINAMLDRIAGADGKCAAGHQ